MYGKNCKVAKFGGTSVCDGAHFERIRALCEGFGDEHCIVASAPGKRFSGDVKVTDMLIALYDRARKGEDTEQLTDDICRRFSDIAHDIGLEFDARGELSRALCASLESGMPDEIVSRGEYLCTRLLADYLGYEFIDAADIVLFDDEGVLMMQKTLRAASRRLKDVKRACIPGFYGRFAGSGEIRTFSRGGSDVTGSLIARAVNAVVYENWTDVSGFYTADPRIIPDARLVESLDFNELRELSCMGASVLHGSTVLPLIGSDIPIHVKNTNIPDAEGTLICPDVTAKNRIAGIAGKRGYTMIKIKKLALGDDSSFARCALHVFEACSVPVEHVPLSMDNLSVVTFTDALAKKRDMLKAELESVLGDIQVEFSDGLSLVAAVSSMLGNSAGAVCTLFNALAKNEIRIRLIDTGSGSDSVVAGVDDEDFEKAIRAIYYEFEKAGYLSEKQ